MNRRQFIESCGATCQNWAWSWSFVNHAEKIVIFGAWDINEDSDRVLILSKDWEYSSKGRKLPGYKQAIEHIHLIEKQGYRLMTFPMKYSVADESDETAPAKIEEFSPELAERFLIRVGDEWYASDVCERIPEEVDKSETFIEGASYVVSVNAYERNPEARAKCLAYYGYRCIVCHFSFEEVYGAIGENYIHVHHLIPLSETYGEYEVDPINDLVPVCPNCHAMIHRSRPALSVKQLQKHLRNNNKEHDPDAGNARTD